MIAGKNILLISPEPWDHIFVSKHHYAVHLAQRGNNVYFLNPPSQAFESKKDGLVNVVDYKSKFKGLSKLPSFANARLIESEVIMLEKQLGVCFEVIWNFDPSRFFNLSRLSNKLKIFHLVDWNQVYSRKLLASTADICFTTSEFLKKALEVSNSHTFNIGHGCNFREPDFGDHFSSQRIQIGYIGNLNIRYIDWEVIRQMVRAFPEVDFNFVGPISEKTCADSGISANNNVIFHGKKPADEIPTILRHFDILLMAYKASEHREQLSNPHKMLEYLASGKVVVASYTEEYANKKHLLKMIGLGESMIEATGEVIENLAAYNDINQQNIRINYARQHSYLSQIEKIEKLIDEHV